MTNLSLSNKLKIISFKLYIRSINLRLARLVRLARRSSRDRSYLILFGREFQVWTTLFTKKLSLIVAQEYKLFLTLELNDSLCMLRLFPRTFNASPDISTFFLRFSGFTQLILSLLLETLCISIKSPLNQLWWLTSCRTDSNSSDFFFLHVLHL